MAKSIHSQRHVERAYQRSLTQSQERRRGNQYLVRGLSAQDFILAAAIVSFVVLFLLALKAVLG